MYEAYSVTVNSIWFLQTVEPFNEFCLSKLQRKTFSTASTNIQNVLCLSVTFNIVTLWHNTTMYAVH